MATLLQKDFRKGEERKGNVTLTITENLAPGTYKLAIKVNGQNSTSWNVSLN